MPRSISPPVGSHRPPVNSHTNTKESWKNYLHRFRINNAVGAAERGVVTAAKAAAGLAYRCVGSLCTTRKRATITKNKGNNNKNNSENTPPKQPPPLHRNRAGSPDRAGRAAWDKYYKNLDEYEHKRARNWGQKRAAENANRNATMRSNANRDNKAYASMMSKRGNELRGLQRTIDEAYRKMTNQGHSGGLLRNQYLSNYKEDIREAGRKITDIYAEYGLRP